MSEDVLHELHDGVGLISIGLFPPDRHVRAIYRNGPNQGPFWRDPVLNVSKWSYIKVLDHAVVEYSELSPDHVVRADLG